MVKTDPLSRITTLATPQTEKAHPAQVKNHAGGYAFKTSEEEALLRFLVLGTTGGTYYQGESELTKENAKRVIDFAQNNGTRLVEILTDVSVNNRAPKVNPTVFALAVAASVSDEAGRKAAFDAMPAILRTGTHFMLFHKYVRQFRGWGMGLRKAGQRWLDSKSVDQLAYQMVKYRSREGYTQRDLLRLIHPKTTDPYRDGLYKWVTAGAAPDKAQPKIITGFEAAQKATKASEWVQSIETYGLSWEMLPDAALKEKDVWNALLDKGMPMTALIRQLPRLTNLEIVAGPLTKGSRSAEIAEQLTNPEYLKKARIHPYNVLVAQRTYAAGRSFRGSSTWSPDTTIVDALDKAFYASFGNVEPANKRTMIGLDVSGSMGSSHIMDGPLTAREGSAAMSLITAATEPWTETYGFTGGGYSLWGRSRSDTKYGDFYKLDISPRQRLDSVIKKISGLPFGSTDVALPMTKALEMNLEVDTFIVITDNETWAGRNIHPFQALEKYRNKTGINSRLIVVGMTATEISVINPEDKGSLGVVGFDSAAPNLISSFSRGDF